MYGLVENGNSLRNVQYMGVGIQKVWLIEPCSLVDPHVLFVSRNPDGCWRLSLVGKRPTPQVVRKLVTGSDEEAIRIAGLVTAHDDPVGFYDAIIASIGPDESFLVPAELCERIHRAMRVEAHAA